LTASGALAGADPRSDIGSGWSTQEWPQEAQTGTANRLFISPFRSVRYQISPTLWANASTWWKSFGYYSTGEITTDFIPGMGIPQAPYGLMAYSTAGGLAILRTQNADPLFFFPRKCSPSGTPVLIGDSSKLTMLTLEYKCSSGGGTLNKDEVGIAVTTGRCSPAPCVPPYYTNTSYHDSRSVSWLESGKGTPYYGLNLSDSQVFFSVDLQSEKKAGIIHSFLWESMTEKWRVPLQTGSGLDKPIPRGQPPPASGEVYQATTPVSIRGTLAVVGAVKMQSAAKEKVTDPIESALFAFNTVDGTQRWVYKITKAGYIMSTPAMLGDSIVFGTSHGRFFSVGNDGKERWKTTEEGRYRAVDKPWVSPSILSEVVMLGPAVDAAANNAYFSGSDGRIYRVGIRSGAVIVSEPLAYYFDPEENTYRTFTINTPPTIGDGSTGSFLTVIMSTRWGISAHDSASALVVVKIPEMTRLSKNVVAPGALVHLDPATASIVSLGTSYGAVLMTGKMTPMIDHQKNLAYFDTEHGNSGSWTNGAGGVSISNGFVFATDPGGFILALRSSLEMAPPGIGFTATPGPYSPPFALDPIQVYPNPFRPDKAFGGTAKFRNLPRGSKVELFTLAYERVRLLTESGFRADWDGKNESGQEVAAGIYHYVITIPDQPALRGKLAVVRR